MRFCYFIKIENKYFCNLVYETNTSRLHKHLSYCRTFAFTPIAKVLNKYDLCQTVVA